MTCHDTVCSSATLADFPDLLFGLYPDNQFPIRAEDYVTCSQWGQCVIRLQEVSAWGVVVVVDIDSIGAALVILLCNQLYNPAEHSLYITTRGTAIPNNDPLRSPPFHSFGW